ncbi:MAG TPA: SRPBCC domain-containing protein [Bacilli bacterium]|nr:SRPBCC domain-containing protein [Bacilli bacterium]
MEKKPRKLPVVTFFLLICLLGFGFVIVSTTQATLTTVTLIEGTPEQVWQELIDLEHYPDWNTVILEAKGELKPDAELKITIIRGDEPHVETVTVRNVTPNRELSWEEHSFLPYQLDGVHYFTIEQKDANTVQLTHWETFTGFTVFFQRDQLASDYQEKFAKFNEALKKRVEEQ